MKCLCPISFFSADALRGYLILVFHSFNFLGFRNLGILNSVLLSVKAMASTLLFLLCQHRKTQNWFWWDWTLGTCYFDPGCFPKRSPSVPCWAKQGHHAFPFLPQRQRLCSPALRLQGCQWDWRHTLWDAHPLKLCAVSVAVCAFVLPFPSPYVRFRVLCGFKLGQRYVSWYYSVACMRGLGEGWHGSRDNHCPLCLLVATYISQGVSGRGLVNVQMSGVLFVTAVISSSWCCSMRGHRPLVLMRCMCRTINANEQAQIVVTPKGLLL